MSNNLFLCSYLFSILLQELQGCSKLFCKFAILNFRDSCIFKGISWFSLLFLEIGEFNSLFGKLLPLWLIRGSQLSLIHCNIHCLIHSDCFCLVNSNSFCFIRRNCHGFVCILGHIALFTRVRENSLGCIYCSSLVALNSLSRVSCNCHITLSSLVHTCCQISFLSLVHTGSQISFLSLVDTWSHVCSLSLVDTRSHVYFLSLICNDSLLRSDSWETSSSVSSIIRGCARVGEFRSKFRITGLRCLFDLFLNLLLNLILLVNDALLNGSLCIIFWLGYGDVWSIVWLIARHNFDFNRLGLSFFRIDLRSWHLSRFMLVISNFTIRITFIRWFRIIWIT